MLKKTVPFLILSLATLPLWAAPFRMPVLRQSFRFVTIPKSEKLKLVEIESPARLSPKSETCLNLGISKYQKLLDEVAENQTPWLSSHAGSLVAILAKQGVGDVQVLFRDVELPSDAPTSTLGFLKIFDSASGSTSAQQLRGILAKFVFDTPGSVDPQKRILQISVTKVGPYCGISGMGTFFDLDRNQSEQFKDSDYPSARVSSLEVFRNFAESTKTHWWNPLETGIQQDESTTIYSEGEMVFNDQKYPQKVDLSGELESYKQSQLGGTCHVYTAVNLAEAACYRRLHKHVPISEAYLFYRHLANKFGSEFFTWEGSGTQTDGSSGDFFNDEIDGGQVENTIAKINNGSVCPRETFVFDQKFISFLGTLATQRTSSRNLLAQLNGFVRERLQSNGLPFTADEKNYGFRIASIFDSNLKSCLDRKMDVHSIDNPNVLAWSIHLLSHGKPFSCSYPTKKGRHVMTVVGYNYNESFPHNVEYRVMESNDNTPSWGWKVEACDRITWIE